MRLAALASILLLAACQRETPPEAAAAGQPVNPDPQVTTYVCEDGETVVAGYPDRTTATLTYKGHSYTLKSAMAASGVRYVGYGLQWWTKGMEEGTLAPLKPGEDIASAPGVRCTAGQPPVEPPAPGSPGGLPDDRTPVSEAPFTPQSAQGAANVVQTYYALLEGGKAAEAAKLRTDGAAPDLSAYATYHAQIGAPGRIEGAAGSLYVEAPVVIYGRRKDGREFHESGRVVLRRSNDVPGSTAAQRAWRIDRIELKS